MWQGVMCGWFSRRRGTILNRMRLATSSRRRSVLFSYAQTDQPIGKFLAEFGISRQKAEKHLFLAGGGFPDLFVCFQCIEAARLKANEKTLLVASMGGNVEFGRMSKQLRQLFQAPNAVTKEDILQISQTSKLVQEEDPSYEARLAPRKGNKQRSGTANAPRPPSKSAGKKSKPKKMRKRKMVLTVAPGNAFGVTDVEVNTIFCPNVR